MKFEKTFTTYKPESHGLQTGSNNGNYAQYTDLRMEDGKFYIKYSSSGDGDMFPYPEWEEVTAEEFFNQYEKAAVEEHEEYKGV